MSLADDFAEERARRIADRLLAGTSLSFLSHDTLNPPASDAEAIADRVVEHWYGAAESLVLACFHLVSGLSAFAEDPEKLNVFLTRLVAKRVLSENDVLARLKANGKLAMLRKIGCNAHTLLQPPVLCLLPAHYSIIYQICLLIEEVGCERAEVALAGHHDTTRDDVVKIRAALKVSDKTPEPVAPITLDDSAAQLFAVRLTAANARLFQSDYAHIDTLDECLRRPQPADNAGLVAMVPILLLGAFERSLMPLLGFVAPDHLYFATAMDQPEITDRDVIVVAKRGGFRPRPLTAFPSDTGSVLTLAEHFFPDCGVKCQLFADVRTEGWLALIGDENWVERPSVR
jgi:hypothetical protein